ncbi:MAG: hypothetical protein NVS3B14_04040 [Ktedonobacteraceae bacterium]
MANSCASSVVVIGIPPKSISARPYSRARMKPVWATVAAIALFAAAAHPATAIPVSYVALGADATALPGALHGAGVGG